MLGKRYLLGSALQYEEDCHHHRFDEGEGQWLKCCLQRPATNGAEGRELQQAAREEHCPCELVLELGVVPRRREGRYGPNDENRRCHDHADRGAPADQPYKQSGRRPDEPEDVLPVPCSVSVTHGEGNHERRSDDRSQNLPVEGARAVHLKPEDQVQRQPQHPSDDHGLGFAAQDGAEVRAESGHEDDSGQGAKDVAHGVTSFVFDSIIAY